MTSPISPAFAPFLAHGGATEKRDAIVVYKSPPAGPPRVRGRLRQLKRRLDDIKTRARAQEPVEQELFSAYRKAGERRLPGGASLGIERIGRTLPVAHAEVTPRTLPELAEQPNVVAILPNQRVRLIGPRAVRYDAPRRSEAKAKITWGLETLEIPKLWKDAKTRGSGIHVAVLDTGVYADHPVLKGRVADFVVIDPLGRRISAKPAFDAEQHGTHVCGTIAGGTTADGVTIGIAPESELLAAACLLGEPTLLGLFRAIDWAIERDADIISMSLGLTYYEPAFAEVFQRLIDLYGILPVVAIGNESHGNTSSPGSAHNALAVGAVERGSRKKLEVAAFSSGASLEFPGEAKTLVTKPDVVAPGVDIYSCIPPEKHDGVEYMYTYMEGTSMATPHVAGAAALLMAAKPDAPVTAIMDALRDTAKHPDRKERRPDNRWGYGLIRPAEALKVL